MARTCTALLAISLLFAASAARAATVLPVEDRRFNQGTGIFPATEFPAPLFAPFQSFIGNVVGDAIHDSRIDAAVMSGNGQVIADGGGGAGGTSHFELVFRVDEAVNYTWSGSIFSSWIDSDDQGLDVRVDTPALRDARLLRGTTVLETVEFDFGVSGRLDPGVDYTLLVTGTNLERPFEEAVWDFVFAIEAVPEPGSLGLGFMIATSGILARWWTPRGGSQPRA